VPTERAYRYYVDRWVQPGRPDPVLGARLATAFQGIEGNPGDPLWVRHAAKVLSEAMQGICVALPTHLATSRLVRLEFVPLSSGKLVAVWVGTLGTVEHQVLNNTWGFSNATLVELGNFATARFSGCSLPQMRDLLISAFTGQAEEVQLRRRLSDVTDHMTLPSGGPGAPVVAGLGELGRAREFGEPGAFRSLVEAFEQHERLARLLNAFAESATREVQLLLGTENPFLQNIPLATALRTVTVRKNEQITFALVGPLRMDYVKLVGSLAWWSDEIQRRKPSSV
jgi:heat-inducible transcriptional repressor